MLRKSWWKWASFLLLLYTCSYGFLVPVPSPPGVPLKETIRNLFFHVPMWIAMMVCFSVSAIYAIKYLRKQSAIDEIYSTEFARTGTVLGVLGTITGMIWANYQWGKPWSGDAKQNGTAIALLIYFAYFVLKGSLQDEEKQARIGAVYNIFAYFMLFPCIWILPRLAESLHPGGMGNEGNPALDPKDTTNYMRLVMYPAFIGWTLLSVWITTLLIRVRIMQHKKLINE
ncbi:MAG: Heme exporter protein [Sediminibacterium sp.]|nr:Heme exporter protein [Sediminibacterium sp.]